MLTEEQKRMHRVCFTGHRPEKLKQSESVIVKALETAIKEAIADGKNVFISGMARGVDIWAAEIVLRLRKEGANVKLICASPYEGFERGWSAEWQRRYNVILAAAATLSSGGACSYESGRHHHSGAERYKRKLFFRS